MYSRFRIYFLDILNDSLNAFSYRFIYIVAVNFITIVHALSLLFILQKNYMYVHCNFRS